MANSLYSSYLPLKGVSDTEIITVQTTAGAVAAGASAGVKLQRPANAFMFILNLTAAATDVGDTLDVQIQTSFLIGGSEVWVPVVSFTQCLGNGGAKRHVAKLVTTEAQAMFENAAALAAGSIRHLFGDTWRATWVTVDADADSAFTFGVYAIPM